MSLRAYFWGGPAHQHDEGIEGPMAAISIAFHENLGEAKVQHEFLKLGISPVVGTPTAHYVAFQRWGDDILYIFAGAEGDPEKMFKPEPEEDDEPSPDAG